MGIVKEWASTGANDPIAATRTVQLGYDACGISMCFLFFSMILKAACHVLFLHFVNVHDVHCPLYILCILYWSCISHSLSDSIILILYFVYSISTSKLKGSESTEAVAALKSLQPDLARRALYAIRLGRLGQSDQSDGEL